MRTKLRSSTVFLFILLISQLSGCLNNEQFQDMTVLGSFPKSITFDNEGNAYIGTVNGQVIRYDGQTLTRIIDRGSHGMDYVEKIRFSQDRLYIHNKRYTGPAHGYTNEVLMFTPEGEYIDRLLKPSDIKTKQFEDIVVNHYGQLYSITNLQNLLRVNFDKQDLINITPLIRVDSLSQGIVDALNKLGVDTTGDSSSTTATSSDGQTATTTTTSDQTVTSQLSASLSDLLADATSTTADQTAAQITLPLFGLSNITIDTADNVYLSCLLGVFKFDSDGNYIKTIATAEEYGISIPHILSADPYGNIIVAGYPKDDAYDMRFIKFNRNGTYAGKLIKSDTRNMFTSIQDIIFDEAGNFYVVDFLKGIYKFDQTGHFDKIIARPFGN